MIFTSLNREFIKMRKMTAEQILDFYLDSIQGTARRVRPRGLNTGSGRSLAPVNQTIAARFVESVDGFWIVEKSLKGHLRGFTVPDEEKDCLNEFLEELERESIKNPCYFAILGDETPTMTIETKDVSRKTYKRFFEAWRRAGYPGEFFITDCWRCGSGFKTDLTEAEQDKLKPAFDRVVHPEVMAVVSVRLVLVARKKAA